VTSKTAKHTPVDLEQAMAAFAGISGSLVQSYEALAERARLVEDELGRANQALAAKVAELDEVNRHLEAVLRSLPTGVIVRDAAGRILRANAAAAALSEARALPARLDREELFETTGPDGARKSVATRRSIVRDERGESAGFVDILDDRTELVAMSERVHVLDKMAALGTMGGGIAHEIRNPLNAVKGFAALLARELTDEPKLGHWAASIVAGAAEADAIIESLLAFASPERVCQDAIDGGALLRDAARAALGDGFAAPAAHHPVTLRCDAPDFQGDRIKLRQALRNLIANAAQAQPEGGAIEATLELAGDSLLARVRDAGPGIPRELRAKVTDPFFTTRPEGSGLGLALVATIARLHGGCVEVGSAPARLGGAEITVRIPYQPVPHSSARLKKAS
jgi:signal transduction histidine kinase